MHCYCLFTVSQNTCALFQLTVEVAENMMERSVTYYILDIQITGVNDYAPLFLFSPYTVYINEDKKPGSVISNPLPYDFDRGADGTTTSMILGMASSQK